MHMLKFEYRAKFSFKMALPTETIIGSICCILIPTDIISLSNDGQVYGLKNHYQLGTFLRIL